MATDSINDFPVAFALVGGNAQEHMRRFLDNLKSWSFLPSVGITDGKKLYPKVLAEVWPQARHRLCVLHVLRDINSKILDAVKRLRRQKARQGNTGRKPQSTRRKKGTKKRHRLTAKDKAHFVFERRYLIVKRRENLRS